MREGGEWVRSASVCVSFLSCMLHKGIQRFQENNWTNLQKVRLCFVIFWRNTCWWQHSPSPLPREMTKIFSTQQNRFSWFWYLSLVKTIMMFVVLMMMLVTLGLFQGTNKSHFSRQLVSVANSLSSMMIVLDRISIWDYDRKYLEFLGI